MNGGLFKSASRFALVAAAGVLAGGMAAQAADLGGNCCADLEERIAELEAQQGHRVGRKETKEIKERVTDELLPRAFAHRRTTFVWIDPVNGWLVVDAASPAKADEVLELLGKPWTTCRSNWCIPGSHPSPP